MFIEDKYLCIECGKVLPPERKSLYCEECEEREWGKLKRCTKPPEFQSRLCRRARTAIELGINYGQYIASLENYPARLLMLVCKPTPKPNTNTNEEWQEGIFALVNRRGKYGEDD